MLGDEVFVGDHAVLGNDVKVYPFKTIEDGAVVNSSIIWESRGARTLFGRAGVSGLSNVDITPELAAKVAMAYGTSLRKGTTVVTSRDSSRSARMLKRAMMAGLNSSGVNVFDLEVASMPVTRFLVRSPRVVGGLSVRLQLDDPESVVVRFFDATGADISEDAKRKIERLFQREDYRRVLPEEIGDISFPPRALEDYTVALEATVDIDAIFQRRFKLVVDHGFGATSFVMPNVLAKLGADVLSVNPYASTSGMIQFDVTTACEQVAGLVRASGAHLGAVFDPDGERLFLVDDEGEHPEPPRVAPGLRRARLRAPARRPHRPAGDRDAARPPAGRRPRCPRAGDEDVGRARWPMPPPSPASASPPTATAGSSCRASCRPSTPPPPSSRCSTSWRASGAASPMCGRPCRGCTSPGRRS